MCRSLLLNCAVAVFLVAFALIGAACNLEKDLNSNQPPTATTPGNSISLPATVPPVPLRPQGPNNGATRQFADGSVLFTMGGESDAIAAVVDFRELDPANVPRLPFGFSPPIRMFSVEVKASGDLVTGYATAYPVTLAVRIDKESRLAGDPHLQELVPLRYDDSLSAWGIPPFSLDHPWLRVEAASNALGIFAVASHEISGSGMPDNPTLTAADGSNPTDSESPPGSPTSVSFPKQLPRPSPSPVRRPPVTSTFQDQHLRPLLHLLLHPPPRQRPRAKAEQPRENAPPVVESQATPSALQAASVPTPTPTPTATRTPTPTPTPTVTPTPTPTPTAALRHLLFLNGRQVLSNVAGFRVPLGTVAIHNLPGRDGRYAKDVWVSFEVEVSPAGTGLQITGADEVEGTGGRVLMRSDRHVWVYISHGRKPGPPETGITPTATTTSTPNRYADFDADSCHAPFAIPYTYSDTHAHENPDTYTHSHKDTHADTHAHENPDTYTHSHKDTHADTHAHENPDSNIHSYPHSHAVRGANCVSKRPGW